MLSVTNIDSITVRLHYLLIERGRLSTASHAQATQLQQGTKEDIVRLLLRLGMVSEVDMAEVLAELCEVPLVRNADFPVAVLFADKVRHKFLKESVALPLKESDEAVSWVLGYPHDAYTRIALEMAVGKPAVVHVGLVSEILGAIEQLDGNKQSAIGELSDVIQVASDGDDTDIQHLRDLASEAPIVRLVNLVINQAVESRASDIHIEPHRGKLLVRYYLSIGVNYFGAPYLWPKIENRGLSRVFGFPPAFSATIIRVTTTTRRAQ
jgi:general secretion pathway protein E